MPSTRYDNLVKDDQDLRIPIHDEDSFEQGITFQAKLIGWQDVPRPTNRVEIVQAMRRIRYEGKVQNIKKKKVTIEISVEGVKVCLKRKKRKKKGCSETDSDIVLMNHPIYRIFYVSHDSSDLKIFSYIARDGSTDNFTCSVFKSNKKSQAMKIVRTVGQAFEVCHKKNAEKNNDDQSAITENLSDRDQFSEIISDDEESKKDHHIPILSEKLVVGGNKTDLRLIRSFSTTNLKESPVLESKRHSNYETSTTRKLTEVEKLREQLEQQTLRNQQTLEQLVMLRNQLISETNTRIECQSRVQQLAQQNRELLETIASLGGYVEPEKYIGLGAVGGINLGAPQSPLPLFISNDQSPIMKFPSQMCNNAMPQMNQKDASRQLINHQIASLTQQLNTINGQQNQQQMQQTPFIHPAMFNMNPALLNQFHPFQGFGINNATTPTTSSSNDSNNNISSSSTVLNNSHLFNSNAYVNWRQQLSNNNSNVNLNHNNNNNIHLSNSLNSNHLNLLSSNSSIGNLTPSPHTNTNQSTQSISSLEDPFGFMMESQLQDDSLFIKPISQVGTLTTLDTDGKVKVIVPITKENAIDETPVARRKEKKVTLPEIVTLKVTDERGNVTKAKKLPATPSFITRSTSEKVPNRSQVMSQVQRTQWARHTTK